MRLVDMMIERQRQHSIALAKERKRLRKPQPQPLTFKWRWFRIRWYLRYYNEVLRNLDIRSLRAQQIIRLLNGWWERFNESERQFILAHEKW